MFFELYTVRGESMMPSFQPGDRLLALPGAYGRKPPARGVAVVVDSPAAPGDRYLKRIVGLSGEEVRLSEGYLWIDGEHLDEPYLGGLPASLGLEERVWKLAQDEVFVMGDNRARSTDSREFGPVGAGLIVARVSFRWWPLRRWGWVG